ncbi:MAG: hypothetical protein ABEJ96_07180 [Thiohalorhabdaceae bacterium]
MSDNDEGGLPPCPGCGTEAWLMPKPYGWIVACKHFFGGGSADSGEGCDWHGPASQQIEIAVAGWREKARPRRSLDAEAIPFSNGPNRPD